MPICYRILFQVFLLTLVPLAVSAATTAPATTENVGKILQSYYPRVKYQQINPTPIEGIYEIIAENNEVVYFAPATGHMIFGEIWSADRKNLTRETKDRLMAEKINLFPLDKAIKIGNGPHQVIEVTDPDCPFCRQGSAYFAGRNDITRYVFLFPLDRIHPKAEAKARYILSSPDPAEAYEAVFGGDFDDQPLPEFQDNGRLDLHRSIAHEIGVTSTPQYWIDGHHINGFNQQMVEQILGK